MLLALGFTLPAVAIVGTLALLWDEIRHILRESI